MRRACSANKARFTNARLYDIIGLGKTLLRFSESAERCKRYADNHDIIGRGVGGGS